MNWFSSEEGEFHVRLDSRLSSLEEYLDVLEVAQRLPSGEDREKLLGFAIWRAQDELCRLAKLAREESLRAREEYARTQERDAVA